MKLGKFTASAMRQPDAKGRNITIGLILAGALIAAFVLTHWPEGSENFLMLSRVVKHRSGPALAAKQESIKIFQPEVTLSEQEREERKKFYTSCPQATQWAFIAANAARWKLEGRETAFYIKKALDRGDYTTDDAISLKELIFFETLEDLKAIKHEDNKNSEGSDDSNVIATMVEKWLKNNPKIEQITDESHRNPTNISMPASNKLSEYLSRPEEFMQNLRAKYNSAKFLETGSILYDYYTEGYNAEIVLRASTTLLQNAMEERGCPVPTPVYKGFQR